MAFQFVGADEDEAAAGEAATCLLLFPTDGDPISSSSSRSDDSKEPISRWFLAINPGALTVSNR